jgi:hypothetical protein
MVSTLGGMPRIKRQSKQQYAIERYALGVLIPSVSLDKAPLVEQHDDASGRAWCLVNVRLC